MESNNKKDNLENALSNLGNEVAAPTMTPATAPAIPAAPTQPTTAPTIPAQPQSNEQSIPKEEEIGFHKGSLNTLMAERNEIIKMITNIEAIMKAHITRLKELGVDIQTQGADTGNKAPVKL